MICIYILTLDFKDYEGNAYTENLAAFDTVEDVCKIAERFETYINIVNQYNSRQMQAVQDYYNYNPVPVNNQIIRDKTKNDFATIKEWQDYCNQFIKKFGSENHKRQLEYNKKRETFMNNVKDIEESYRLKQSDTDFSNYEWTQYTKWYIDSIENCSDTCDHKVDYVTIEKFKV